MSNQSEPTQAEGAIEPESKPKRYFLPRSPRVRTALGIAAIVVFVVVAFLGGPRESDSDNVTGDPATMPTVSVTQLIQTIPVNRNIQVQGVQMTIIKATLAQKFSDDRKRTGNYTVRVTVQAKNGGQSILGVDYASFVRLVSADGAMISPKFLSVQKELLPHSSQTGFFDFPISDTVPLSSLSLWFNSNTVVPL